MSGCIESDLKTHHGQYMFCNTLIGGCFVSCKRCKSQLLYVCMLPLTSHKDAKYCLSHGTHSILERTMQHWTGRSSELAGVSMHWPETGAWLLQLDEEAERQHLQFVIRLISNVVEQATCIAHKLFFQLKAAIKLVQLGQQADQRLEKAQRQLHKAHRGCFTEKHVPLAIIGLQLPAAEGRWQACAA